MGRERGEARAGTGEVRHPPWCRPRTVPRVCRVGEGPSSSQEVREKAEYICALFVIGTTRKGLALRAAEHWSRLPVMVVESPSVETFPSHLDAFLCKLLWVTLPR